MKSTNIPTVALPYSLFYNLAHVLPYYLQGIFTRSKFWVSFWTRVHPDPLAVRFISFLRRKYKSNYLYLYLLRTKSLLVLDPAGIQRVLDYSPVVYAEAKLKRDGMSHFQPHAVTISRGAAWTERRRFNESVLDTGHAVHQYANHFLDIIRSEIAAHHPRATQRQSWEDFERLFERLTLQIIFGKGTNDRSLTDALRKMMRESNRVFALKKSRYFDPFYRKIRTCLAYPQDQSLAFLCRRVPSTDTTKVENQIPHWMFAILETLATNTIRALALIVAHPEALMRVREELARVDLSSAQGIQQLQYLEGCIQEAMRLWPSTPLLVRETLIEDVLGNTIIPPATQVLILNNFNHRDKETHPFADTFSPELWSSGSVNYHFNHFSNGPQGCAGKELALFIAKAVLATLLSTYQYTLERPPLDPSKPLPYMYNNFHLQFRIQPLEPLA